MLAINISKALIMGATMFASTGYCGQMVKAVWKESSFNTISSLGGLYGSGAGFALLKDDGGVILALDNPGDYAPCMGEYGSTFTLTGGCLKDGGEFAFNCYTKSGLTPSSCAVRDKNGNDIVKAKGTSSYDFFGIGMGLDGYCGAEFELGDGVDCEPGVTGFKAVHTQGGVGFPPGNA